MGYSIENIVSEIKNDDSLVQLDNNSKFVFDFNPKGTLRNQSETTIIYAERIPNDKLFPVENLVFVFVSNLISQSEYVKLLKNYYIPKYGNYVDRVILYSKSDSISKLFCESIFDGVYRIKYSEDIYNVTYPFVVSSYHPFSISKQISIGYL